MGEIWRPPRLDSSTDGPLAPDVDSDGAPLALSPTVDSVSMASGCRSLATQDQAALRGGRCLTPGHGPAVWKHSPVSMARAREPDDEALARELGLLDATAARRLRYLRDGFLGADRWVIFVGAGVSRGSGIPNWDELTRRLAKIYGVQCPERPADNAYPGIIEACLRNAPTEAHFWDAVADLVCGGEPSEMHALLMQLPFDACLTTNFDCLLDTSHGELNGIGEPRVISYPRLSAPDIGGRRVVHLHGRCNHDPTAGPRLADSSTVFTQSGYFRAYGASSLPNAIEGAIDKYFFLFIGASLGDWQIRELLNRVRDRDRIAASLQNGPSEPRIRGFALVESDGTETGAAADWTWPGKVLGLDAIFYVNTDGDHVALRNAVRWLVRETSRDTGSGQYRITS